MNVRQDRIDRTRRASDRYFPAIQTALAETLGVAPTDVVVADLEEDYARFTDIIVQYAGGEFDRVGFRVRGVGYHPKYQHDFTIRMARPSGFLTEIDKIMEGWGDYLFYAHAGKGDGTLLAWFLGDLSVFRQWYRDGGRPSSLLRDSSNTCGIFDTDTIPAAFIVASFNIAPRNDGPRRP